MTPNQPDSSLSAEEEAELRRLPDGSLTREEVNDLLDTLDAAHLAASPDLDVETLARAITANWTLVRKVAWADGGTPLDIAQALAAEYTRLRSEPIAKTGEPGTEGRCGGCGGPHRFDTSVPSPAWNAVIRAAGMSEYLCTSCIVEAFVNAGRSFEAELYGPTVNRDGNVPVIRVQVDERPLDESYGDLQAQLRDLEARSALPTTTHEKEPHP